MYELQKAKADIRNANQTLTAKIAERDLLHKQLEDAEKRKAIADEQLLKFDLVQILLQMTSEFARQQAKQRIEEIVTSALSVVFGKDYQFSINITTRANQPVAEYFLESEGVVTQLRPPDYDRGGGVADVVSLALTLAVSELSGIKRIIALDEVGKHVSQEYAPNVAYFLKQYSENFNKQILLITHNTALAEVADHSLSVSQVKGASRVEII